MQTVIDFMGFLGLVLVLVGLAFAYWPLAVITLGCMLCGTALRVTKALQAKKMEQQTPMSDDDD
jgi:hypothetical protein